MTLRSLRSRRTTATRPNSWIRTTADRRPGIPIAENGAALSERTDFWPLSVRTPATLICSALLCLLASTLDAQEIGRPGGRAVAVPRTPVRATVSSGRSRYSSDAAEIKCARLESEAVFFERLGKQ